VKVGFRESFSKDLAGIKDKSLLERVRVAIEAVEKAGSLSQINGLKKLKGGGNYYRLRIGDFRVGMVVEGNKIVFVRFINRKDAYRYFP
jgi:mRNA interferase RelE/StbE